MGEAFGATSMVKAVDVIGQESNIMRSHFKHIEPYLLLVRRQKRGERKGMISFFFNPLTLCVQTKSQLSLL